MGASLVEGMGGAKGLCFLLESQKLSSRRGIEKSLLDGMDMWIWEGGFES